MATVRTMNNKAAIVQAILSVLQKEQDALVVAARQTHEASISEESRPESKYDTQSIESSYLANAQADKAGELGNAILAIHSIPLRNFHPNDPIALSALVWLQLGKSLSGYFLAPAGGGTEVNYDGKDITVVTPASPLGQALLGKTAGAVISLPFGKATVETVC